MLKAGQANELSKPFRRDRNKISRMTSDSDVVDGIVAKATSTLVTNVESLMKPFDETRFTGVSHGIIAKLFLRR